nr:MAG TPA: hypothetical protein [Caudoviricetes sp.]
MPADRRAVYPQKEYENRDSSGPSMMNGKS